MQVQFSFSGLLVFETDEPVVPPVGSSVVFNCQAHAKGMEPGDTVAAIVADVGPVEYDYTDGGLIVRLDLDSPRIL